MVEYFRLSEYPPKLAASQPPTLLEELHAGATNLSESTLDPAHALHIWILAACVFRSNQFSIVLNLHRILKLNGMLYQQRKLFFFKQS